MQQKRSGKYMAAVATHMVVAEVAQASSLQMKREENFILFFSLLSFCRPETLKLKT